MRLSAQDVNVTARAEVPRMSLLARIYLWLCERLYDELAWMYDWISWIVSAGHWRSWQAGVWHVVQGQDVLEVGCGTGAMLVDGVERGLAMVGVDRSPHMLAVAQQRLQRRQSLCGLLLADGHQLPLASGAFDAVIATFPARYIFDPSTLAEIRRVLRKEGQVVILGTWVELQLGSLAKWLPVFYGRPRDATLAAYLGRVAEAGFVAHWVEQKQGRFSVGVLVAKRKELAGELG